MISARIRKKLLLRYGSVVRVEIDGEVFSTKIDERGRFGVPVGIRQNSQIVDGIVSVFEFSSNGCDSVAATSESVAPFCVFESKKAAPKKYRELKSRVQIPVAAPFSKKIERRRF